MIQRLNVPATVQKSRLYIGYHVATATLDTGEEVDVIATPGGVAMQMHDRKTGVSVSYEDLVKEALKVV